MYPRPSLSFNNYQHFANLTFSTICQYILKLFFGHLNWVDAALKDGKAEIKAILLWL